MEYGIFNGRSNGTCITSIPQVGVFSPTSVEMFRFDQEVVWSGGTTTALGDNRDMVPGCSFEKKYHNPFPEGQYFHVSALHRLFHMHFLIYLFLYRYSWKFPLEDLESKQQFELLDGVRYWGKWGNT